MGTATISPLRKQPSALIKTEQLWLAAVAVVYLMVAVRAAWLRPLVFHEYSTLFVSSTPTLREMFAAVPADGNPPLHFVLVRLSLMLPIKMEVALRVPAMIAYLGAALTVCCFVRRDVGRIFGWLALCVFLGCSNSFYMVDARPYPMLLFFTGLALCCWQAYSRSGSRWALAGITVSVAGAVFSHQYGVIYTLCPLCAGEVVRSVRRRKIDAAVIAAAAAGALTVFLTFPPMLRAQKPLLDAIRTCPVFAARPHWSELKYYVGMVPRIVAPFAILAAFVLILWVALTPKKVTPEPAGEIPAEDWAVAIAAALLLPVILLVTHFGTNYYQARYGMGSGLGVAMLCGMLLSRWRWRHADSLVWTVAGYSLSVGLLGLWLAAKMPGVNSWDDPILRAGSADQPIVVANATEFPPMWWHSDGAMRARVHYLTDTNYAARQSGLVPEFSLMLERAYLPMRLDDYETFIAAHQRFLLYCSGGRDFEWIKQRLAQEGWRLTLLQSAPAVKGPGAKAEGPRELYEVSR